jgi:hypothetical protein
MSINNTEFDIRIKDNFQKKISLVTQYKIKEKI